MAISSAICSSFKQELLQGKHSFESSGGHTFKIALFTSSASLGAATTDYSTSNEISNTSGSAYSAGGATLTSVTPTTSGTTAFSTSEEITNTSGSAYTSGGATLTSVTPVADSTTAVCDFADVSFSSASFTANGALIYNDDQSDKAVAVIAFGGDKTVTSGTFTIQFPTADASNAIIRLA